jgi:hypothetical protein
MVVMLDEVWGLEDQEHLAKTFTAVITEDQSRNQYVATPDTVQAGTIARSGHQRHIDPKVRLSDSGLTALSLRYI